MSQKPPIDERELYERLRKRMLMFYFAAGLNLVMAMWVMSMGVGQAPGGTLMIIMTIFLAFAGLNFYMARLLQKQWNAHLRQKNPPAE
jgi:polyferredoxin